MQRAKTDAISAQTEQLFLGLSEQLRYAFLQVARAAELAPSLDQPQQLAYWQLIKEVAEASMQIADSYALQARIHSAAGEPQIETFAASSLLYDTAQALNPFAKQYGVQLQLNTQTSSSPIMGNREVLEAAMLSIGQVFVIAEAQSEDASFIRLAAHQSRYGVVAGVYAEQGEISAGALRRARQLVGKTSQPFTKLAAGPVAGVFIAESLLQSMATRLHVAHYQKLSGLAVTLPSCNQLQLV